MRKVLLLSALAVLAICNEGAQAQSAARPPVISVVKRGAEKDAVSLAGLKANGPNGRLFTQTLRRNLELSGWFRIATEGAGGSVTLVGVVSEAGGGMQSNFRVAWPGKAFTWTQVAMGQAEVRRQAQRLTDEMVRLIQGEVGIAQTRIVFVNRRGPNNADLYMVDADGQELMQLTRDHVAAVGPRWAPDGRNLYYTSFVQGYPTVARLEVGGGRSTLAAFRGLNTGAAVSPDGRHVALILSYQGNPELYALELASGRLRRLTQTPQGVEASPCWSPDGRSLVYVSDISRAPQLYLVDVASRQSRRLTFKGSENVSPDWSAKGQLVYATRRAGGYQLAVMDPARGEASAELITPPGDFESPSWAANSRHIVYSSRNTLYILDTLGDPTIRLISVAGNWISPNWSRR